MSAPKDSNDKPLSSPGVSAFLDRVAATPRRATGPRKRLIFALDATASRQPTWDRAAELQAEMFKASAALGSLDIQLCHYRGMGEFAASDWCADSRSLLERMNRVRCLGGRTQIGKVLAQGLRAARERPVQALVFIGDAVEEDVDHLCDLAGQLGLRGLPLFLFMEGEDSHTGWVFEQLAQLSGGVCCRFDASSIERLRALLGAVASYAAGGRAALGDYCERARLAPGDPLRRMLDGPR